jgi:hypothetical protein
MSKKLLFIVSALLCTILSANSLVKDAPAQLNSEISKPTFLSKGTINTLAGNNNTWIVGGNWIIQSINGKVDNFNMDLTMIAKNGTLRHHMTINNFTQPKNESVKISDEGDIKVNGSTDMYAHGKLEWGNVTSNITIDEYSVLHVNFDNNKTKDHFKGGINGITNSFINGLNYNRQL